MAEKADYLASEQERGKARISSMPPAGSEAAVQQSHELHQIREDIRQTEASMANTLIAIEERLTPSRLVDQAKEEIAGALLRRSGTMIEAAGKKMREIGEAIKEKVEENPIPVTLLGLGVGWLVVDGLTRKEARTRPARGRYRGEEEDWILAEYSQAEMYPTGQSAPEMSERSHDGGERPIQEKWKKARTAGARLAEQVRHKAKHYSRDAQHQAEGLKQRAHHLSGEAQNRYHRGRRAFSELLQDNPLLVGVATLAVGAVVGLLIPETRKEHEWMGEARDSVVEKGWETGRELKEKAERVVRQTGQAAADEAERQELTAEGTLERVEKVVQEAGRTAAEALDEEVRT